MKILTVATDFPFPPTAGTTIVAFERIRELSRRHEVTLLCVSRQPVSADRVREMERFCRCIVVEAPPLPGYPGTLRKAWQLVQGLWFREPYFIRTSVDPDGLRTLERAVDTLNIDIVDADAAALPYLRAAIRVPKIAIFHSLLEPAIRREIAVADTIGDRWKRLIQLVLVRWSDQRLVRSAELCVTVTPEQREQFQQLHPGARVRNCFSLGIDFDYFEYAAPVAPPSGVCFLGKMDYGPNIDAVLWFYRAVFPIVRAALPNFRFSIVGSHPGESIRALARDTAVDVTGFVEDIRPFVRSAGIQVLPMRAGGGILNKLLQGLALGVPNVATPMALEGNSVVPDRDLLVGESPEQLAAAIVKLATDTDLRLRLATSGRQYVEQNHRWGDMVRRYEAELEAILRQRRQTAPHSVPSLSGASQ